MPAFAYTATGSQSPPTATGTMKTEAAIVPTYASDQGGLVLASNAY